MNNNLDIGRDKIEYEYKILYAITIVFIVMSHFGDGDASLFIKIFPPYSFAISPFIFAAGYFYKSKYENNIGQYIIKKIKRLIIPLYLWNFFYGIIIQIGHLWGVLPNNHVNLKTLFVSPFTTNDQFMYNLSGWFLIPLFFTYVINIIIRKIFRKLNIEINELLFFLVCLFLGCLACVLETTSTGLNTGIYLFIIRLLFFLPFFSFGTLYRKYKQYDKLNNFNYFSIIIFTALLIMYFNNGSMPTFGPAEGDIAYKKFLIMPYLIGILGTAFYFRISKILEPSIGKSKHVQVVADNTYTIMINHLLGFKVLCGFFYILHKYTPICTNFSVEKFKTAWNYCYLPHNQDTFLIVYVVFSILFSIYLQKIIIHIYNLFIKSVNVLFKLNKANSTKINY